MALWYETCSRWQLTCIVFYDLCFIVFYLMHFVGKYIEFVNEVCGKLLMNFLFCMNLYIFPWLAAEQPVEFPPEPCNPSPCGANAVCKERNGAGSCTCLPEYSGDPYTGCRPECVLNTDCSKARACVRNKCVDPCPGTCGLNAECRVVNHAPSCSCLPGYTGNPLNFCNLPPPSKNIS